MLNVWQILQDKYTGYSFKRAVLKVFVVDNPDYAGEMSETGRVQRGTPSKIEGGWQCSEDRLKERVGDSAGYT